MSRQEYEQARLWYERVKLGPPEMRAAGFAVWAAWFADSLLDLAERVTE